MTAREHRVRASQGKARSSGIRSLRFILGIAFAAGLTGAATSLTAAGPSVINLEIDWMANASHSHRPSQAEIDAIVQMFACHGITLNAVIDDSIPHINVIPDSAGPTDFFEWSGTNSFRWHKNQYFDNSGGGWHYCIFAHQYDPEGSASITGSSGLGENGGDDFIVTLGAFTGQIGTPFDRASTCAHELGHNLGLRHFAGSDSAAGSWAPNYASIMSYQYQLLGVKSQMRCLDLIDTTAVGLLKEMDFSNGRFPSIDENSLNENTGVGMRSIDWNCDSSASGVVSKDLDGQTWCDAAGAKTVLADRNDWATLVDNTFGVLPPSRYETCVTADEVERNKMMSPLTCSGSGTQPALVTEACIGGLLVWANSAYVGSENGTGDKPFNTFLEAYNAATSGSAIYLQAGSYNTNGGTVLLTKPMTLAGPGSVTITR
jgi:hypothetical protein